MAPKRKNANLKGSKPNDTDEAAVEILPYLFLGPRSAATEPFLASHDITHVLSIGATPVSPLPQTITYTRLPLLDSPRASLEKVYDGVAQAINAARDVKGKILVHCSAGMSRSPTVITAYLMKEHGMTLKEALGMVIRKRPAVSPHPGLFVQLKAMELELRGTESLGEVESLPLQRERKMAIFAEGQDAVTS
ncbi:hypothetical protein EIP91_009546 [Steccherinum ochraceum]|uniref:protein-tyrosine-phosphatase n=1 Tax=Steccherinum ochraceum TaxID=92696 RepID=A0A4R0R460_9APHY|nr:hypothetical protein EIP91_009546 [Steccherinum ochraceum]